LHIVGGKGQCSRWRAAIASVVLICATLKGSESWIIGFTARLTIYRPLGISFIRSIWYVNRYNQWSSVWTVTRVYRISPCSPPQEHRPVLVIVLT
jgi:hypothetical protein